MPHTSISKSAIELSLKVPKVPKSVPSDTWASPISPQANGSVWNWTTPEERTMVRLKEKGFLKRRLWKAVHIFAFRYFECRPHFGLFAPISKVSKSPSKHKPGACIVHSSGPGLPPSGLKRTNSKESMTSLASKTSAASSVRRVRLGVNSLTPKVGWVLSGIFKTLSRILETTPTNHKISRVWLH